MRKASLSFQFYEINVITKVVKKAEDNLNQPVRTPDEVKESIEPTKRQMFCLSYQGKKLLLLRNIIET